MKLPAIVTEPIKTERIAIAIKDLPPHLSGTKIVQLSDLHYDGVRLADDVLERAIDLSNAADPDLVVLTGDFVTDNPAPIAELASHLSRLRSKHGIFGCLGNHDLIPANAKELIISALAEIELKILWNEVVYPLGGRFGDRRTTRFLVA